MPTNRLPPQPTSFIGREKELTHIADLLADNDCRLLMIVGPGGIGKTRLALEAARHQEPYFEDGVFDVALAPVVSSDLLVTTIADRLGLTFRGQDIPQVQLSQYLQEKHLLLVLDNFEHLIDASVLLSDLLRTAPKLKLLVTSRERLNLQEEWAVVLEGLAYPEDGSLEALESFSAVRLFAHRARQVHTKFLLQDHANAVAAICRQVEGMPLGLELAASWLRVMSCEQIVVQMGQNLDFLATPMRNVPERHRSLRKVFEQSWHMLTVDEQSVLMRLSVFRGGFNLESAEAVAGATLTVLASLVDKSLIRVNDKGRYDLHELLRQYAVDKLGDEGLATVTNQYHIDYFLKFAEETERHLFSREHIAWFDCLEVEMDNFRAVLAQSAKSEIGLRLATALGWFFSERAHRQEGLSWLEQIIAYNPDAPADLLASALNHAGAIASHFRDFQRLQTCCMKALAIARNTNDDLNIAWALSHLGAFNNKTHELNQSNVFLKESVALFRKLNDQMGLAHTLVRLAWNTLDQNNIPYTYILLDEASALANVAGDALVVGLVAETVGDIAYYQHDFKQAQIQFNSSLSHFQQAQFANGIQSSLVRMARAELNMGDFHLAHKHLKAALIFVRDNLREDWYRPLLLSALVLIAKEYGQYKRAARLLGAAYDKEVVYWSQQLPERYTYLRDIEAVRERLALETFKEEWAVGMQMTWTQVLDYALEDEPLPEEQLQITKQTDWQVESEIVKLSVLLTPRELEILRLLSDGLNSREIANRLYLSAKTVRWYLKIIYNKLDVHSRSESIARAKELKLIS